MRDHSAEVMAILRQQEEAVSRGDAAGVVSGIAADAVAYDLAPPLEYRGDAARHVGALEDWFGTWEAGVTTALSQPTVLIDGDLAVVFGLGRMRGTKKGFGGIDAWNRRTIVLKRLHDEWRIVHEHSSYPMAMDGSDKAVTDLTPAALSRP